jgi:hypothetical protein
MLAVERYVIRVANFADRGTMQRLLDSSAEVRSMVGTHLILELIRRVRNDACPIAWAGSAFADSELSRDELSNEAYSTAVTYCIQHTAGVVELMNVDGLRLWLEETLREASGGRLFVPGLWALADWTLEAVMGITPPDRGEEDSGDGDGGEAVRLLRGWGAMGYDGAEWVRESVEGITTALTASSTSGYRLTRNDEDEEATTHHVFSLHHQSDRGTMSTLVLHRDEHAVVAFHGVDSSDAGDRWCEASRSMESVELEGLQFASLGDFAFDDCSALASVTATSPCTLGAVGSFFLANTPKLTSLNFSNIRITTLGERALHESGIVALDLGGLQLTSLGDFAFNCSNLASVTATAPCTLGAVGRYFLAEIPKLSSFSFHNISATCIGVHMFSNSGVVEVDFAGLHVTSIGWTTCPTLTRVIATAATNVTHFAGHTVRL